MSAPIAGKPRCSDIETPCTVDRAATTSPCAATWHTSNRTFGTFSSHPVVRT